MDNRVIEALMKGMAQPIRDYFAASIAPLVARLEAAEARAAAPATGIQDIIRGDGSAMLITLTDGRVINYGPVDGKSVDVETLRETVAAEVKSACAAMPPARDGTDGKDGDRGASGESGRDGVDGKDGKDGADAVIDREAIEALVGTAVDEKFAAMPAPQAGTDADPATVAEIIRQAIEPAIAGEIAARVAAIAPKDGVDGRNADAEAIARAVTAELEPAMRAHLGDLVAALPVASDGKDGRDGVDGKNGEQGANGRDGAGMDPEVLTAFQASLDEMSREMAALKALPVPPVSWGVRGDDLVATWATGDEKNLGRVRGADGADGKRGASMMDGSVDENGLVTFRMSDARNITLKGSVRGPAGSDGRDGADGRAGRDALHIMVLPGIDEARRYPAATFAFGRGGLLYAERETDPVRDGDVVKAGWAIAMRGVVSITDEFLDDGRVLERVMVFTGGQRQITRTRTANMIYRGVWKEGRFERGDVVSRSGSAWHCERETTETPGVSPDWVLSVKRGRDGKETVSTKVIGPVKHDGAD